MHRFSMVDVFADELTLGNPVAVVHEADDLTIDQMAAVARWTNLSETTFLLRPQTAGADYRLRIFTTARELPFAGHPTLGSAAAWLAGGAPTDDTIVQECGAGLVRISRREGRLAFAAPPLVRSGPVDSAEISKTAHALGLPPEEIIDARWVDNGPGWHAVLLDDAASVLAVRPRWDAFDDLKVGVVGPYPEGEDADFEIRAFVPSLGVGEDPVTGSLNAGVAQWLIDSGRAPQRYVASQGTVVGRRGRVYVEHDGTDIWVGGHTVIGVKGTFAL
ncbi:MAG: PhzF family phenazine biosynthesis protein [Actinobacteria bacterium]|nr:PhzF family phenazine biosynthesis protein [Actinomycetota bacterium]